MSLRLVQLLGGVSLKEELFQAAMNEPPAMTAKRRSLIGERLLELFEADRDEHIDVDGTVHTAWWPRAWRYRKPHRAWWARARPLRKPFSYENGPALATGFNCGWGAATAELVLYADDGEPLVTWREPFAEDLLASLGASPPRSAG